MCSQMFDILKIKQFFETVDQDTSVEKVREMGLCLISIIDEKIQNNQLLKDKLLEANEDLYWIRKRADDWMLRAMENSQTKKND
ncbi:hypothetical protein SAMN05444673_5844 [Bacillus sp. OV166]|uniref:hypothetical protein n=1 Tax=Bacillus sp. OV166 TaxID=1882763 RepID=UPI000A2AC23C|nr:hypothetical protein [Bacillus sp. OV166]SMQ84329.1 hypothetical protein SAMN05444673_5844 [Bacillus sp. OV166]